MLRLDQCTFPAACSTEQSSGAGRAGGTLSYLPRHKVKEGNVKPLWEGKRCKHNMGTTHYEHWAEYSFPGMMLWIWEVTGNTERCSTRGCELQQDTKMLLQDWVRLGLNNRCTEYQCPATHRNTGTQRSTVSASVPGCHPQMEQVKSSSAEQWQELFRTATLAKALALLTTEGWTIISAALWPLQFSCEKHL